MAKAAPSDTDKPVDRLTAAMAAASQPPVAEAALVGEAKTLPEASAEAEAALSEPVGRPLFTAHSNAMAAQFNAMGEGVKLKIAEIDAEIAQKNAERDDLMLTYSMLSHGMLARERGAN